MLKTIKILYLVFAQYNLKKITTSPLGDRSEYAKKLTAVPLKKIDLDTIGYYQFKAITTMGDLHDFKHFLPRILELLADNINNYPNDLENLGEKLCYAKFSQWPNNERLAITDFFIELWEAELTKPEPNDLHSLLCCIALVIQDLQPFLDVYKKSKINNILPYNLKGVYWNLVDEKNITCIKKFLDNC